MRAAGQDSCITGRVKQLQAVAQQHCPMQTLALVCSRKQEAAKAVSPPASYTASATSASCCARSAALRSSGAPLSSAASRRGVNQRLRGSWGWDFRGSLSDNSTQTCQKGAVHLCHVAKD